MHQKSLLATVLTTFCLAFGSSAHADDAPPRVDHYEARQASSISEAVSNLREVNAKLQGLLNGALSDDDLHEVHNLSYTMEDALKDVVEELKALQDVVEEMHLASEGLKQDKVKVSAQDYLQRIGKILKD